MDTAQIKAHLQGRLQQLVAQKLQLDENVNTLGDRVESAIRRAGPRPPGSIDKIEKEIAQQEYYRSTTTMPLNQEKLLIRQQDAAKNKIRLIKEHAVAEEGVQELRTKRLSLAGLNKLELAEKSGVSVADL
eukprot:4460-Heterococcus_DN1.PRE.7